MLRQFRNRGGTEPRRRNAKFDLRETLRGKYYRPPASAILLTWSSAHRLYCETTLRLARTISLDQNTQKVSLTCETSPTTPIFELQTQPAIRLYAAALLLSSRILSISSCLTRRKPSVTISRRISTSLVNLGGPPSSIATTFLSRSFDNSPSISTFNFKATCKRVVEHCRNSSLKLSQSLTPMKLDSSWTA